MTSAVRFQEGLAQIAATLQLTAGVDQIASTWCNYAHRWFDVDRTLILLLQGEELVVRAAEGGERTPSLIGRRIAVSSTQTLEVEVLRRRSGFFINALQRSAYGTFPLATELGDKAVLLVPLLGSLGAVGAIALAYRKRARRFTPAALQRASILAAHLAAAVENAHLLNRVREEAESVTALLGASERLTNSEDLPSLLTDLNRIAADIVGCPACTTFLWDAGRNLFYFGSSVGAAAGTDEALRRLEFARDTHPLAERVLAAEAFVLPADEARALLPAALQAAIEVGPTAIIPLRTDRALQGLMAVSDPDPTGTFRGEQLWMLRGIARHAALAIERTRLIAEERDATATAEALVTLGRELSATLDRRKVLARITEMAATAAGCDFGVLAAWERGTHSVRVMSAHGLPAAVTASLLEAPINIGDSPFATMPAPGWFERDRPAPPPGLPPELAAQWQVGSVLGFMFGPIEQRAGTLVVGYRDRVGPFTPAQRRLVEGIAQQAMVAVENARLVEDLRQANRLKSDFLSTVSHELRTPLNAIIGYSDLLRERTLGPLLTEQVEVADTIAKKALQLADLINTTLDLTRLEAGQVYVHPSEFHISEVLNEIEQDLTDEVPPHVAFAISVAPDLPVLATDRAKLKTVVKNLVHNALKFTPRGQVGVRAELAPKPQHLQLVVRDTGIGIAPENLKAIFEMFRQLEPALTRHYGGVGLGLYIVQRFLDLIGGEVRVHSEQGRGSIFTVTVPLRLQ